MRPLTVLLAAPLAALAVAAPASATTYCVDDPACPAGGVASPDLPTAAAAARSDGAADTVRLGPGDHTAATVVLRGGDALAGAGSAATTVTGTLDTDGRVAVSGLTVRLPAGKATGIQANGGSLADVAVDGAAATGTDVRGILGSGGVTIDHAAITMAAGVGIEGGGLGGPKVTDSTVQAPVGAAFGYYGMTLTRTTLDGTVGVRAPDGAARLDAVLIRVGGPGAAGVVIGPSSTSPLATTLTHVTLLGDDGAGSVGIASRAGCAAAGAAVTVTETAIAGFATHLERSATCPTTQARLAVTRSAYDPERVVSDGAGAGTLEAPVTTDLDLGADLVPLPGSGLVDAGDPAEAAGTDLRGAARPADGNGDGTAIADVGALELQPAPPSGGVGDADVDSGAPPVTGGGGVLGESAARLAPTALRLRAVRYRAKRPGRFEARARLAFPAGTDPSGGRATLTVTAGRKTLGRLRTTVDRRGHADFKLRVAKGVKRSAVRLQVRFAGTDSLTAFTSRKVRLP